MTIKTYGKSTEYLHVPCAIYHFCVVSSPDNLNAYNERYLEDRSDEMLKDLV